MKQKSITEIEARTREIYERLNQHEEPIDYNGLLLESGQLYAQAKALLAQAKGDALRKFLAANHYATGNEQKIYIEDECKHEIQVEGSIAELVSALKLIIANRR